MDFDLTKEQKMLQKSVREYMKDKIIPIADEYDKKGPMAKKDAHRFLRDLVPFGYVGALVPEELGGPGLGYMDWAVIIFELRKAYASLGGIVGITTSSSHNIALAGSDVIRKKCLPGLLSGDKISCTAITEPEAGSDPSSMQTTAVLDGDHYVINGTKMWISNGSIADYVIVTCTDETRGKGRDSIIRILVDKEESPFQASEIPKIGVKSFPTSELVFKDCRVPAENLLQAASGKSFDALQKGLIAARCNAAVGSCAIAEAALEAAIEYAKGRKQFGKVIGSFQMIQQLIAEMIIAVDAGKLLAFRAYKLLEDGKPCRSESSVAKAYCTEMAVKVASKAMQVLGAYGLSTEFPLERYFRDARVYTFPDGTTQIQHLIIAREALGISAIR
ncbi:MAG: acyl-CoA dehydrogenase [Desulfobacteraceae bacterium]|nr:acyl-CoA dehydrogenase [Desulfobacteraceae bacterium]